MTPDRRMADIAGAVQETGLECLVMGGHAVRYYGVDRNTVDFDFVTGAGSTDDIRAQLALSERLGPLREGPSWRPRDFARFEVGRLPDGREEWLEFWVRNHLLPDFGQLNSRCERGTYGRRELAFLSLDDLLRSKETERESDWQDISLLEEVLDARNLAAAARAPEGVETFLSRLRSRRGFGRARSMGMFADREVIRAAIARCEHPVSFAFLAPAALSGDALASPPSSLRLQLELPVLSALSVAGFGTPKHMAITEIVRRAYKRYAMEIDRQTIEAHRAEVRQKAWVRPHGYDPTAYNTA